MHCYMAQSSSLDRNSWEFLELATLRNAYMDKNNIFVRISKSDAISTLTYTAKA